MSASRHWRAGPCSRDHVLLGRSMVSASNSRPLGCWFEALPGPPRILDPLDLPFERPWAGFWERVYYDWLDRNLRSGEPMRGTINGEIVSEDRARRLVAYARRNGFLPP